MVLRCNHTIIYEGQEERQGSPLQLLQLSDINSVYNMFTLSLEFYITASLHIPGSKVKKTKIFKTILSIKLNLCVCRWL